MRKIGRKKKKNLFFFFLFLSSFSHMHYFLQGNYQIKEVGINPKPVLFSFDLYSKKKKKKKKQFFFFLILIKKKKKKKKTQFFFIFLLRLKTSPLWAMI